MAPPTEVELPPSNSPMMSDLYLEKANLTKEKLKSTHAWEYRKKIREKKFKLPEGLSIGKELYQ